MNFYHFGLIVRKFDFALSYFENECSNPIYYTLQDVGLILCKSKFQPWVELIKPVNKQSPVNNYLNKNNELIYHICYEVDNIEKSLNQYFSSTINKCVSKPKPAVLFNNRMISFYYVVGLGLIEFLINDNENL